MVNCGFTYTPSRNGRGIRGDVRFSSHNATNRFLDYVTAASGIQVISGTGQFFSFSLGPSYAVPFIGRSNPIGFAQVGLYRSTLRLPNRCCSPAASATRISVSASRAWRRVTTSSMTTAGLAPDETLVSESNFRRGSGPPTLSRQVIIGSPARKRSNTFRSSSESGSDQGRFGA